LKVLHVINSLAAGGAERLVADLLPQLRASGVDAELLVLDAGGDAFSGGLAQAGVPVAFARPRGSSPYSPLRLRDISRKVREREPDLVHAHLAPTFHWCALSVRDLPLVATEHATINRRMGIPALRSFERFCYERYASIACVSGDTARALVGWTGLATERFPVIPNGIPLERFSRVGRPAADVAAFLSGRRGIAMTARLVPAKGHEVAIGALARLPEDLCMVFVGEGPERPSLEDLARRLGVSARCLFLGSRADVPAILEACDLYLQTSYAEGFGIAALEAMAAGLPVVASDSPGLGGLVRGAGALFPTGDAEACAAAIGNLLSNGTEMAKLRDLGLYRAGEFSIERCAERYTALYGKVLAESREER
jgi:glycosyltransferase involved in cell wall biosynthesis